MAKRRIKMKRKYKIGDVVPGYGKVMAIEGRANVINHTFGGRVEKGWTYIIETEEAK